MSLILKLGTERWREYLEAKVDLEFISHIRTAKVMLTPEGGVAVKIINDTGDTSVKGSLVTVSGTTDNSCVLLNNEYDTVGIVYESGIANGSEMWIVVSGIADVLFKDDTTVTRGYLAIAADTDGRAITIEFPTTNPVVGEHFKEIGHCMESKTAGTNVLAKCVIHFN